MRLRPLFGSLVLLSLAATGGWTWYRTSTVGEGMTAAAGAYLTSLTAEQKKTAVLAYDDARRVGWHFVPQHVREGLQIKEMTSVQQQAAHKLLQSALSEAGYAKATKIMSLEKLLRELEGEGRRWPRDWEQYYFTVYGDPSSSQKWGLSVEGHHLSLNFVIEGGQVLATTPQAMAANPAEVKNQNKGGFELGLRVLAQEESLAFDLLKSLDDAPRQTALIDAKAPSEVRSPGSPQPPTDPAVGLPAAMMTSQQQTAFRSLIDVYAQAMPREIAEQRWADIEQAGFGNVHFAWAGASEPGIGHYYRVQGPTFVIEFVNVQPDAAGNPANHIHCFWRDMRGDFALPITKR